MLQWLVSQTKAKLTRTVLRRASQISLSSPHYLSPELTRANRPNAFILTPLQSILATVVRFFCFGLVFNICQLTALLNTLSSVFPDQKEWSLKTIPGLQGHKGPNVTGSLRSPQALLPDSLPGNSTLSFLTFRLAGPGQ